MYKIENTINLEKQLSNISNELVFNQEHWSNTKHNLQSNYSFNMK